MKQLANRNRSWSGRVANATTLLMLIGVVALQWRAASVLLGSSLMVVPADSARHYTSGVMVFDYLRNGLGSNPVRFAEDFDVRYPLVAIGRWPPMYYVVQAIYYLLAMPSIRSAQILSALMAACLALLVFRSLRVASGSRIAIIAAGIFLATPLVQATAWEVMSDLLTGLFVYLAILAFSELLDDCGNSKAAVAFVGCAIAAVLTKGSAWSLAPFFFLAPALARRNSFFRSRWFIGTVLAVVLLGSIFYLLAARFGIGYPMYFSHYLTESIGDRRWILSGVVGFAPVTLLALGLLGASVEIYARWRCADESRATTLSLVATAWIASQFIFLLLLPMTPEPRVLLPSLAPLAILTGRFLLWLQGALRQTTVFAAAVPAVLAAIIVANSMRSGLYRVDGLRQAANTMPYPPDGALILVAAWGFEDGVITERLSHSLTHTDVILRGTQVLANIDSAGNETPAFQSAEALRAYLLQMPVRFVVLGSPPYRYSFQALINSAVTGDPQDFHQIATVPIVVQPGERNLGQLRIYENSAGRDRHPNIVQTRLGSTGRIIEYHWK